ncbi:MAG TPA: ECF-type sigma factor [Bryobacteraceae bacterium]|nr:ECF-type sigma factor [Bryobacteraceae bacterium]
MEPAGEITRLLHAWSAGDRSVEDRLFRLVLPDLRNLARALMRRERRDHTLQASALLNEAYVRLLAGRQRDWEGRRHFYAVAARIMRRLLIDHARARTKSAMIPIQGSRDFLPGASGKDLETAVAVDSLLDELQLRHPDWCSIVELKYFMGLTDEETAEVSGLPLRTMQRQFSDARRWLFERLNPTTCETQSNATNA